MEHKVKVVTAVSIELSSNGISSAEETIKSTSKLYLLALSTPYIFVTLLGS